MNVLLVHPEFPDTFWSFRHALKFIRKRAVLPPLGLLTVAAMLPQEWPKRLADLNVAKLRQEDLAWADLVFLSGMAIQEASAREVIARCREAGVRIVAGGPLFTASEDRFPEVDYLVLNEAELTLPLFLADLEKGSPAHVYRSTEFADVGDTPAPLWELADLRRYHSMGVQFSRGCPYNCDFCNVTALFGHRPRTKQAGQVLAELDTIYGLGWRGPVFFVDDNFIGNRRALRSELLPALIAWQEGKRGITFYTESSINLADDEALMRMMGDAGFDMVFVGIETPEEEGLAECGKKHNRERDLIEDVKRLQRAGLQVQGGFIVGFDSDTPATFRRQIRFIQNSGIVTAMVGMLQAPQGTPLYERLKKAGRVVGLISGDNADGETNILPVMGLDALRDGYRAILRHIYAPGPYYRRIRTLLREYRAPKIRDRLSWPRLLTFLQANVRLGILGKERFHYWKLLLWTSFRRPELLSLAVTLAISGHHFRRVFERRVL